MNRRLKHCAVAAFLVFQFGALAVIAGYAYLAFVSSLMIVAGALDRKYARRGGIL